MNEQIQISTPFVGEEEFEAVLEPLRTGWITQGPKVSEFENAFARRHDTSHALAVTSCTTGLHLALAALGIGPGDEVIVPAFTWVATANVVVYCGAKPVLVDVESGSFNLGLASVVEAVTENTKAVVVVHLFGLCVDVQSLRKLLPDHVAIVEDAACATGASVGNVSAGALGDVGVFSFHPRKVITTGEGGMVTTNNADLADRMEKMRNHGAMVSEEQRHLGPKPYLLPDFPALGFNYRMTDLQGAIGLVQLNRLNNLIDERTTWARYYQQRLSEIEWLILPTVPDNMKHGWQAYVTVVDESKAPKPRNEIMEELQERGIATRPGTHALHMLSYYRDMFGFKAEDFPIARMCNDQSMAIPLHNRMTEGDYEKVVDSLLSIEKTVELICAVSQES